MKISVIDAENMDASLIDRWEEIRKSHQTYQNPFYAPRFSQLVRQTGQQVYLAVVESDSGSVDGFFPFERGRYGQLLPVGQFLSDYHGIIALPTLRLTGTELLKACGSRYASFNHIPVQQSVFAPNIKATDASPALDLTQGWDGYVSQLANIQKTKSPGVLTAVRQSVNRITRDLGPIQFECESLSSPAMQTVMDLKTEQWKSSGQANVDPFSIPWVNSLMWSLFNTREAEFSGYLSTLRAGDKLLACHFGMRSGSTLHYWFPVYDPNFSYYQPGLVILKLIAEIGSASCGIQYIDLGRGHQPYKTRFSNASCALGEGSVSRPSVISDIEWSMRAAKSQLRRSPLVRRAYNILTRRH